jgi:hypothetical protein
LHDPEKNVGVRSGRRKLDSSADLSIDYHDAVRRWAGCKCSIIPNHGAAIPVKATSRVLLDGNQSVQGGKRYFFRDGWIGKEGGKKMTVACRLNLIGSACAESVAIFIRDVGRGLFEVGHSSLALIGLVVVAAGLLGGGNVDLRMRVEQSVFDWLQARSDAREQDDLLVGNSEPDAASRATAADPSDLTKPQAAVALWLARRYRVAPEPVSKLVQEAWKLGRTGAIDPTLILAVMAIESRFNPFAQSTVGAQGLMQVMTRIHDEKYEAFGGSWAAFDPVTNLRVGAQVLKECISRAGGLEAGLRFYVGAAHIADDGGYVDKVLAEQANLLRIASGKAVAIGVALPGPAAAGPAAQPLLLQSPAAAAHIEPVRVASSR